MTTWTLRGVDPTIAPGLSRTALRLMTGDLVLPTATAALRDLEAVDLRSGVAWSDASWGEELTRQHRKLGASPASLESIRALRAGEAGCVVTGQQPGILGGPLYTAYKIVGAIALARALAARHHRRVVPVYWCGSDDSDFDEVRRVWFWSGRNESFRVEADPALWSDGQRVGSVSGAGILAAERGALDFAGESPGATLVRSRLEGLPAELDLGERMMALVLGLFATDGLVVVDARSGSLRALGRDLFARYLADHRGCTEAVRRRGRELKAQGLAQALGDRAVESGLFRLEGDHRHKLSPDDLDAVHPDGSLAPSVLLRPLWQDALLAPAAAVLGPAELAYHAQIAPLYDRLEVRAAAPAPRPHLTLVPSGLPWPEADEDRRGLLAGGEHAVAALRREALPAAWRAALDRARRGVDQALEALRRELPDGPARAAAENGRTRLREEVVRLEQTLHGVGLETLGREADVWRWAPTWLAPRGVPQERALAATVGWWRWGEGFDVLLSELGRRYAHAIAGGEPTTFVAHGEPSSRDEGAPSPEDAIDAPQETADRRRSP